MNKVSELSDDLEAVSVVLGELKRELRTHRRFISTLLHIFHGITDFRESYKVTQTSQFKIAAKPYAIRAEP